MTKADAKKPTAAHWQSVSATGKGREAMEALSPKKLGKSQIMAAGQRKSGNMAFGER